MGNQYHRFICCSTSETRQLAPAVIADDDGGLRLPREGVQDGLEILPPRGGVRGPHEVARADGLDRLRPVEGGNQCAGDEE
jgi:hypothetical protein